MNASKTQKALWEGKGEEESKDEHVIKETSWWETNMTLTKPHTNSVSSERCPTLARSKVSLAGHLPFVDPFGAEAPRLTDVPPPVTVAVFNTAHPPKKHQCCPVPPPPSGSCSLLWKNKGFCCWGYSKVGPGEIPVSLQSQVAMLAHPQDGRLCIWSLATPCGSLYLAGCPEGEFGTPGS